MRGVPRSGRCGVHPERGAEGDRGADLAGQRELLGGELGRLLMMAERSVRGGRSGAPGRGGGIVDAECAPARARREQILQRLGVAALRHPQSAPSLQEGQCVDPAGGGSRSAAAAATASASPKRPRRASGSMYNPAAQATASGGEGASLKARAKAAAAAAASNRPGPRLVIQRRQPAGGAPPT